jgi:hypothetical protein
LSRGSIDKLGQNAWRSGTFAFCFRAQCSGASQLVGWLRLRFCPLRKKLDSVRQNEFILSHEVRSTAQLSRGWREWPRTKWRFILFHFVGCRFPTDGCNDGTPRTTDEAPSMFATASPKAQREVAN